MDLSKEDNYHNSLHQSDLYSHNLRHRSNHEARKHHSHKLLRSNDIYQAQSLVSQLLLVHLKNIRSLRETSRAQLHDALEQRFLKFIFYYTTR